MTGEQIKTFREGQGWSQQELARRVGVDQATISRIERGSAVAGPVKILLERLLEEDSDVRSSGAAA